MGCGNGRASALLARAGYRGRYVGVDIENRFAADKWAGGAFETRFILGDAHEATGEGPFDLILSPRQRWPRWYAFKLGLCLRLDTRMPLLPVCHVVCKRRTKD